MKKLPANRRSYKIPAVRTGAAFLLALILSSSCPGAGARAVGGGPELPGEVRGYKVERAKVNTKRTKNSDGEKSGEGLITFGTARVSSVGPLEVPVTIAPVQNGGEVELLVFEGVEVNGTPVSVDDYKRPFSLPKDGPLTLADPLRLRIGTTRALIGTVGEIFGPTEVWPVTGRVYVCGRYKRFLLSFKRAVPLELKTSIRNPL